MHPVGCLNGSAVGACFGSQIAHKGFCQGSRGITLTPILKAHTGATAGALISEKQEGKGAVS